MNLKEYAIALKAAGVTLERIGKLVGRSTSTVHRWVTPGAQERAAAYTKLYFNTPSGREAKKRADAKQKSKPDFKSKHNTYQRSRYQKPLNRVRVALAVSRAMARKRGYAPCKASAEEIASAMTETCPICSLAGKRMAIDHDHVTGKFRGWVCTLCNSAIGMLGENPETLKRAVAYLS